MATLDPCDILDITRDATYDQAMKVRDALRYLLRAVEDIKGLPRSFETKQERVQREIEERRLIHHE